MAIATVRSLLFLAGLGQPAGVIRALLRSCSVLALILAFTVNGRVALAQDAQVTIVPRVHAVPARDIATDDNAQQSPATPRSPQSLQGATPGGTLMLPPGTKLPLGLLRPLSIKSSKAPTDVYLQITFPVTVGGQMLIPPGAYLQGSITKVKRHSPPDPKYEFEMRNASLTFSTGYNVPIAGDIHLLQSTAGLVPPSGGPSRESVPAMGAVGTITPPPLPGPPPSFRRFERTVFITMGVVAGAAVIGGTAYALRHRNEVYLETGTPLEIILSRPLLLDADQVYAAVHQYSVRMATAPPQIVEPPKRPQMCYDPGTPGTPDTVIPGTPATPPTVIPGVNGMPDTVIPGSPGTPDTVIPGTPGTPGSWHPCP